MSDSIIIIALLVFLVYREWQHDRHIKGLEEKLMVSVPGYVHFKGGKKPKRRFPASEIMKEDDNEIMLADVPHMDIPKDFKIETEESPTTPTEARARKGR